MIARAQSEIVRELFRDKLLVEELCAFFKSVAIVVTAIKIELQVRETLGMLGKRQGAVRLPVGFAERGTEGALEDAR